MFYVYANVYACAYVSTAFAVCGHAYDHVYVGTILASGGVCGCAYARAYVGKPLVVFWAVPMPMSAQCLPAAVFVAMPMPMSA